MDPDLQTAAPRLITIHWKSNYNLFKTYCKIVKTVKSAHKQTFKCTYLIKGCVYVVFLLFQAL